MVGGFAVISWIDVTVVICAGVGCFIVFMGASSVASVCLFVTGVVCWGFLQVVGFGCWA